MDAGLNVGSRLVDRFQPTGGIETSESVVGMMRFRGASFRTRPTPTPSPTEEPEVYVPPAGSLASIIYAAAAEFGIDGSYLLSVASCESGLNVQAYSPAGYHGLFQFDQATWAAYGYGSIYDATAQARTAARLIAAGQASRWPNCA
jgi:soluble lytic murein transglycosylase-like protein